MVLVIVQEVKYFYHACGLDPKPAFRERAVGGHAMLI